MLKRVQLQISGSGAVFRVHYWPDAPSFLEKNLVFVACLRETQTLGDASICRTAGHFARIALHDDVYIVSIMPRGVIFYLVSPKS